MAYTGTTSRATNWALDLGFTTELAQGLRLAATADQLNHKRLWDVDMKPQFRAALQIDLGPDTKVSLEGDINSVERMPFPVKQQSTSASLRMMLSEPAVISWWAPSSRRSTAPASPGSGPPCRSSTSSLLLSRSASRPARTDPMKA